MSEESTIEPVEQLRVLLEEGGADRLESFLEDGGSLISAIHCGIPPQEKRKRVLQQDVDFAMRLDARYENGPAQLLAGPERFGLDRLVCRSTIVGDPQHVDTAAAVALLHPDDRDESVGELDPPGVDRLRISDLRLRILD